MPALPWCKKENVRAYGKAGQKAVLCIHRPNQPNKQALPAAVLKMPHSLFPE
ncbi:hypothetical protein HMPREF1548_06428 [Clostridium sp. KLE 1755]|nr:hypothetical protein HMPREF1548_06428 [Clostridium sp. KLE 1755]